MKIPVDPAILLLGICPNNMKNLTQKDLAIPMHMGAPTTAKSYNQFRYSSTGEFVREAGAYNQWNITQL